MALKTILTILTLFRQVLFCFLRPGHGFSKDGYFLTDGKPLNQWIKINRGLVSVARTPGSVNHGSNFFLPCVKFNVPCYEC